MTMSTPCVGMDAHAATIQKTMLQRAAPGPVVACYEAGPCGFALQRRLQAEGIDWQVIAPTPSPPTPGDSGISFPYGLETDAASMRVRQAAPGVEEPDLVKICPACRREMPPASRVCHFCLSNLRDAPLVAAVPVVATRSRWSALTRVRRRRWLQLLALALAAGVVYAQCFRAEPGIDTPSGLRSTAVGPEVWAAGGLDAGATRVAAADPPLHGDVAWRRSLDAPATVPVVTDGRALFVGLADARLIAYAVDDGRELWSFPVPGQLDEPPVIAGDVVYLSERSGGLTALDAATGAVRWRIDSGDDFLTAPAVRDGVVWVGGRGRLMAFDAENGEFLGEDDFGPSRQSSGVPVVGDERVVVRSFGRLHFFDLESGDHTFFGRLNRPRQLAAGHGVVIAASERWLMAFAEDEGNPWWEGLRTAWVRAYLWGMAPRPPHRPLRWALRIDCAPLGPTLDARQVIVACEDGLVRAVDLDSGVERWVHQAAALTESPVLLPSGLLLIEESALVVLDPESGAEVDRRALDGFAPDRVTVTGTGLYIVTADDELLAIR